MCVSGESNGTANIFNTETRLYINPSLATIVGSTSLTLLCLFHERAVLNQSSITKTRGIWHLCRNGTLPYLISISNGPILNRSSETDIKYGGNAISSLRPDPPLLSYPFCPV